MSAPVAASQRFTSSNPCPVCGGHQYLQQGRGIRCAGYLSGDGGYVHCSREEHATNLAPGRDGLYAHRLGDCRCGVRHGDGNRGATGDAPLSKANTCAPRDAQVAKGDTATPFATRGANGSTTAKPTRTDWPILDAEGQHVATHVRIDKDGGKRFVWELPDGSKGLGGMRVDTLPLYGADTLADLADGDRVVVCEGEKSADALTARGVAAVATVTGANVIPSRETLRPLVRLSPVLWPDADDVGKRHMQGVAVALVEMGAAPPSMVNWPDAPPKGDAADFTGSNAELAALLDNPSGRPQLRWRTARELAESTPETTDWLAEGLLARGALTEFSAKIKLGKTTLVGMLVAALTTGGEFLGKPTVQSTVLWLTEERDATFRDLLARSGLLDCERLHILQRHDAQADWPTIVEMARVKAREVSADVLIVDTLSEWAGFKDEEENQTGAGMEATRPLALAASDGLAVLANRHDRKSGGELGDSSRGTSSIGGGMDILLQLTRADADHGTRRVLKAVGRFDGIPPVQVIELRDGRYHLLGDSANVERQAARDYLLETLYPEGERFLSERELTDSAPETVKRTTLQNALRELEHENTVVKRPKCAGTNNRSNGYALAASFAASKEMTHWQQVETYVSDGDVPNTLPRGTYPLAEGVANPPFPKWQHVTEENDGNDEWGGTDDGAWAGFGLLPRGGVE